MSVRIGTSNFSGGFVGTNAITKIYEGTNLVWQQSKSLIGDPILAYDFTNSANVSGTTVTDLSGNGYNGVLSNANIYESANGWVTFDASNEMINLTQSDVSGNPFAPTSSNIPNDTDNSGGVKAISTWIFHDSDASARGFAYVIDDNSIGSNTYFVSQVSGNYAANLASRNSSVNVFSDSAIGTFTDLTWHHFVFQFDPNGATGDTRQIYVDGVKQTLTNDSGITPLDSSWIKSGLPATGNVHRIGDWRDISSDISMTKIYIYDKPLTQQEITDLFNEGSGV